MLGPVVLCVQALAGAPASAVYAGVAARDPALDAQAERIAIALGQALEKKGALDLGSPPLPDPVDGPDAILSGAVQAAKAKYLEGDFAQAAEKAGDAIARFEAAGAFRGGPAWAAYGDALVLKSLALKRLNREADADAALAALAATMPKMVPDPGITPPKVAQRYQQILDELKQKPRVSIEVASTPAGADVVVDGVAQGKAPVVVRDLLPGVHFVALAAEGERVERKVNVAAGSNGRVDERVGDARAIAARALRAALAAPVATEVVVEKAKDVGDDVVVGALVADVDGPLLVAARVRAGALIVAGARLDKKSPLKMKADAVADALAGKNATGGWVGKGPATPDVVLTSGVPPRAVAAAGNPNVAGGGGEGEGAGGDHGAVEPDATPWIAVGVGVAIVVVVGGGATAALLVANQQRNKLSVQIDASALARPP